MSAVKCRNAYLSNVIIDGVDCTRYFGFPFTVQQTLDESLDSAVIMLMGMERKEPFAPFSDAELGTDTEGRIDMIVGNDKVTEIFGRGLYNHEITLLEPTKMLERYVMGAKAFTNHQARNYGDGAFFAKVQMRKLYVEDGFEDEELEYSEYTTLTYMDMSRYSTTFYIKSPVSVFPRIENEPHHYKYVEGVYLWYSKSKPTNAFDTNSMRRIHTSSIDSFSESETVNLSALENADLTQIDGYYLIEYVLVSGEYAEGSSGGTNKFIVKIGTTIMSDSDKYKPTVPYTVKEVLSTLNRQIEPLIRGENPRYSFSWHNSVSETIGKMQAPEFKFPAGRTYWENLREVYRYIHCIPRLKRERDPNALTKYSIYGDMLGGHEYADMSAGERFFGEGDFSGEDYADAVEGNMSNLMNSDDELEGSIVSPCSGTSIGITLRSDNARIQQGDSYIPTSYPIEKLLKLEAFVTVDGENRTLDFTPYVFEKSEYDLLSGFSGSYPNSKTYAIYYTQGERNIEGLWYKADDGATDYANSLKRYAYTNIFNAITCKDDKNLGYYSFVFRITYLPSIDTRVRQYKTAYAKRGKNGAMLMNYNQTANKPTARALGESMRGRIAMLGNKSQRLMYLFPSYKDVPRPGLLHDEKNYISTVTTRVYSDFCISDIGLSRDFNELGGYLEMNTAYRQFEIPEECERHYHIDELCVISEDPSVSSNSSFCATSYAGELIMQTFAGSTETATDVTMAEVYTQNENGVDMARLFLPVVSTSIGNSIYFGFRFEDNFSAGNISMYGNGNNYRYTQYSAYGDGFARAKFLVFYLWSGNINASNWLEQGNAFPNPHTSTSFNNAKKVVKTPSMIYDKDAADGGDVNYQIHFVSDSGFIITGAIAKQCPLVRRSPSGNSAYIYYYNGRLNEFTGESYRGYVWRSSLSVDAKSMTLTVDDPPGDNVKFQSWCIKRNGECLIGANTQKVTKKIYFGFKRP